MILNKQRPLIMGILNVTPDSFSDGGKYNTPALAIERASQMLRQGADIIDIGGESTRPGAEPVPAEEQIKRVIPAIKGIRQQLSNEITISVDTTSYEVVVAALEAGANWINDISAGEDARDEIDCNDAILEDNSRERMLTLAAERNVPIVLMHRKGKSSTMQDAPSYQNVVQEVENYLKDRASLALEMGVSKENIIIDPGIGFGKLLPHNLSLLANLDTLVKLGFPVLLGASRKRFIAEICGIDDAEQRVAGTCATTALGVDQGVKIFRVHDIEENRQAADIAWRIKNG